MSLLILGLDCNLVLLPYIYGVSLHVNTYSVIFSPVHVSVLFYPTNTLHMQAVIILLLIHQRQLFFSCLGCYSF